MKKAVFAAAVIVLGGLLCGMFESVHPFGVPENTAMDDYFLHRAPVDRSAQNVVTAIVFDYRGLDTLGQAAVMLAALTSIGALFRDRDGDGGKRK